MCLQGELCLPLYSAAGACVSVMMDESTNMLYRGRCYTPAMLHLSARFLFIVSELVGPTRIARRPTALLRSGPGEKGLLLLSGSGPMAAPRAALRAFILFIVVSWEDQHLHNRKPPPTIVPKGFCSEKKIDV